MKPFTYTPRNLNPTPAENLTTPQPTYNPADILPYPPTITYPATFTDPDSTHSLNYIIITTTFNHHHGDYTISDITFHNPSTIPPYIKEDLILYHNQPFSRVPHVLTIFSILWDQYIKHHKP